MMSKTPPVQTLTPFTPDRIQLDFQWGLIATTLITAVFFARSVIGFFFLFVLVVALFWLNGKRNTRLLRQGEEDDVPLLTALLTFAAYLQANAFWALDKPEAMGKALLFLAIVIISTASIRMFRAQPSTQIATVSGYVLWAALICFVMAGFEALTNHPIKYWFLDLFPALRKITDLDIVHIEDNKLSLSLALNQLNRSINLIVLFMWPALLLATHAFGARKIFNIALIVVTGGVAIMTSENETAQVALITGAIAFFGIRYWARGTHQAIIVLWCMSVLFVVPATIQSYKMGLHQQEWLPTSARQRVIIWDYTAEQTLNHPLLGIGTRSTRLFHKTYNKPKIKLPGQVYKRTVSLHAHNQFLQIWFELGFVGALFILAIGIFLLRRFKTLPDPVRPYAYGAFVTICTTSAFGWGLWQTWLLTAYGLTAIFMAFAMRANEGFRTLQSSGSSGRSA